MLNEKNGRLCWFYASNVRVHEQQGLKNPDAQGCSFNALVAHRDCWSLLQAAISPHLGARRLESNLFVVHVDSTDVVRTSSNTWFDSRAYRAPPPSLSVAKSPALSNSGTSNSENGAHRLRHVAGACGRASKQTPKRSDRSVEIAWQAISLTRIAVRHSSNCSVPSVKTLRTSLDNGLPPLAYEDVHAAVPRGATRAGQP